MYASSYFAAATAPFPSPTASSPLLSSLGSSFPCGHSRQLLLSYRVPLPGTRMIPRPPFPSIEAKAVTRRDNRIARHQRIRKKVEGTPDRPRMSVYRSNKHIYVQVIDDTKMHTLASVSTMQKPVSEELDYSSGPTIEVAKKVGEIIAKSCLEKGILKVTFDRGGYPYHGRIEALASAARESGLQF